MCLGQPYEIGICEDWNAIAWCGAELLGWVDGWLRGFSFFSCFYGNSMTTAATVAASCNLDVIIQSVCRNG